MKRKYRNAERNYYAVMQNEGLKYFVVIGNTHVEVEKPVFDVYASSVRQEIYFDEQYDALLAPFDDCLALSSESAEVSALIRMAVVELLAALAQLEREERNLIALLYIERHSLREAAHILGVHFTTINHKHKKILKKLRNTILQNSVSSDS